MHRSRFWSGSPWEGIIGYSRAVRIGNVIAVSGTTAVDVDGGIVGEGDPHAQTTHVIRRIEHVLRQANAGLEDVVRARIFVTDISAWQEVGRAFRECFGSIAPALSMVEVSRLIDPRLLVEIEADAILDAADPPPGG